MSSHEAIAGFDSEHARVIGLPRQFEDRVDVLSRELLELEGVKSVSNDLNVNPKSTRINIGLELHQYDIPGTEAEVERILSRYR